MDVLALKSQILDFTQHAEVIQCSSHKMWYLTAKGEVVQIAVTRDSWFDL